MTAETTNIAEEDVRRVERERAHETDAICTPRADIEEQADALVLRAEMPGVDQEHVEVTVENNVLTVAGTARLDPPGNAELLRREYRLCSYRRDFELSDRVDSTGIRARMRHGVLEVTLPKRPEMKARRIAIGA